MNSYPLAKARSSLSKLVDQALAGEPQRITRHGKEAVVVVSEADWTARAPARETLADCQSAWNWGQGNRLKLRGVPARDLP